MLCPRVSRRRPGTVLMWFVILAWTLMAVAALVIDLGLVRVTQRQMQSLTDAAAVEAVYSLDQSAQMRQTAAQQAINAAMTNSQTSDAQRFGAGPLLDLSDGISLNDGFSAAQTLAIHNPRLYQPVLAANTANSVAGDIVQGTYTASATTNPPEASDYTRPDFTVSTSGNAILVRLRRSNEAFAAGDASRSAGPPVPYMFARGSMLASKSKGQGVTIRATSIAAARPVLSAGPTLQPQSIPGVAPFMLQLTSWQTWRQQNPNATVLTAGVDGQGNISGNVSGAFTARATVATVIGQLFAAAGSTTPLLTQDSYVGLYDTVGGNNRIVGFLNAPGLTLSDGTLTLPLSKAVATSNATTTLTAAVPGGLAPADLSNLFSFTNNAVSTGSTDPLRAPALVR